MARALVFPGQGAQKVGMGLDLARACPAARAVFEAIDDALHEKLSALIWHGDIDTLTLTANAQPALLAMSMAVVRALEAATGETLTNAAACVAGHSLGEYTALTAAGGLRLEDAARLLRIRGQAMQAAVPVGQGAMAAILGLDIETVRTVAAQAGSAGAVCAAANDNDPGQVVISGHVGAVERAIELARAAGARRAVLLPVSAPFHCTLMRPAAERMKQALAEVTLHDPAVPLVANVLARPVQDAATIRSLLVDQITAPVRWRESVTWMVEHAQVSEILELGAGKALSGMVRKINRSVTTHPVSTPADVSDMAARWC